MLYQNVMLKCEQSFVVLIYYHSHVKLSLLIMFIQKGMCNYIISIDENKNMYTVYWVNVVTFHNITVNILQYLYVFLCFL